MVIPANIRVVYVYYRLVGLRLKTIIQRHRACTWFVPDDSAKNGITRRNRASYVIHGGLLPAYASGVLEIDVDHETKSLTAAIGRLSKYVLELS